MAEAALALTLVSALGFSLSSRAKLLYRVGTIGLGAATLALIALLVYRSVRISFPALTGTYEGLLMLAAGITAFLFISERTLLSGNRTILAAGSFAAFVFLAILNSPLIDASLRPPVPILRSSWLVLHVAFAFIGLSLFAVGMIAGVVGLIRSDPKKTDTVRDRAVVLGFVFYATGGLVFGAIWAEAAWGRFWGWDPKETWALITVVVYAVYLHVRYLRSSTQRTARVLAVVAWAVAIFTFFGVNYLFSGLHSYALQILPISDPMRVASIALPAVN